MLFQVALNQDCDFYHTDTTGYYANKEKYSLPKATIVDVYGIYGDVTIRPACDGASGYTFPAFVIYHESFPCFFSCSSMICTPIK